MYLKEEKTKNQYYTLDNAAIIFSLVTSPRIPALFRLSATLKHPINVTKLQKALENILPRFPYFQVNLRRGLFWFYWKTNLGKPQVILDSKHPCQEMPIRQKDVFPFRVRAFKNRIAVEFHHSITDGTGALTFLKALIGEYLVLKGIKIEEWGDIFRPNQVVDGEEYEDGYKRYYKKHIPPIKKPSKAFRLPFHLEKPGIYHVTTGIIPVKKLLKITKERNVTITEFLASVYISSLQDILFGYPEQKRRKMMKPIKLSIPINLRKIFPSKTLRNFSLWVTPWIDPRLGKYSFDEIINHVHHYMRVEVNDKYINQQVKRNVKSSLNPLVRLIPLFIKRLMGPIIYNELGEKLYSGSLSNLGLVRLPEDIAEHIERLKFIPGTNPTRKVGGAMVSFKDKLYFSFGRVCKESELERIFFRKLVKLGVPVKIETNY